MNATTRFYTVFIIALALVIAASFAVGYRTGYHAGERLVHGSAARQLSP